MESEYYNVLGIIVDERDPWGGVINIHNTDPEAAGVVAAIERALAEKKKFGTRCGSSEMLIKNLPNSLDIFEPMPFEGTIQDEVIIYIE